MTYRRHLVATHTFPDHGLPDLSLSADDKNPHSFKMLTGFDPASAPKKVYPLTDSRWLH
jgi:hypothetical protein